MGDELNNPSSYAKFIEILRNSEKTAEKVQQLQHARKDFSLKFLPDYSFWEEWIQERVGDEEADYLDSKAVFQMALSHFPHAKLGELYSSYLSTQLENERLSTDEFRTTMEYILATCGFDILSSREIWRKYIEFEVDEYEDMLQMSARKEDLQKQKERFIKLFHRQLSLPLIGNEETLVWLDKVLSEHCTESDEKIINPIALNEKYTNAVEMKESRLTFESHLAGSSYSVSTIEEKANSWMSYIKFELSDEKISRAQRLFERSLLETDLRLHIPLWLDYLSFAVTKLKNWALSGDIATRTAKILIKKDYDLMARSSAYDVSAGPLKRLLFDIRCLSTERRSNSSLDEINSLVETALSSRLGNAQDYLHFLLISCDAARRALTERKEKGGAPLSDQVRALQESFVYAENYLGNYYPNWTEGWWMLYSYWTKVVDKDIYEATSGKSKSTAAPEGEIDEGDAVWDRANERFPQSYFIWNEKINRLKLKSRYEQCSKLYKRLFHSNTLDVSVGEVVARDWLQFCRQYCDIESLAAAWILIFPSIKDQALASYLSLRDGSENEQAAVNPSNGADVTKKGKRKLSRVSFPDEASAASLNANHTEGKQDSKPKKAKVAQGSDAPSHTDSMEVELAAAAAAIAAPQQGTSLSQRPVNAVQVRNLPFSATEDDIRSHFESFCGEQKVVSCRLLLSKSGTSRGVANIEFGDEVSLTTALALDETLFHSRSLVVELLEVASAREAALAARNKLEATAKKKVVGSAAAPHLTTVYVSKLSPEVTDADLETLFSPCGSILSAKVSLDKKTSLSKGFGFVQFHLEAARETALALSGTELKGTQISVAPSRFSLVQVDAVPSSSSPAGNGHTASSDEVDTSNRSNSNSNVKPVLGGGASSKKSTLSTTSFRPRGVAGDQKKAKVPTIPAVGKTAHSGH